MVALTLQLPRDARTDVKLKLLRGFCRDVSMFSRIDVEDEELQSALCRCMKLQEAEPHEMVFGQGSRGDTAFCLLSGSVDIAVNGRHIRTIKFGECFCFGALDGAVVRPASAVATEQTTLLTLSRAAYLECCKSLLQETIVCLRQPADDRSEVDLDLLRGAMSPTPVFIHLHYVEPQRQLCRYLKLQEVGSGELVLTCGDVGEIFYLILAGTVAVVIDGEEKRQLGPNESFGEVALLGNTEAERRYTTTIVAKELCTFAVMARADFVTVIKGFEERVANILMLPPNKRADEHLGQLASMFRELGFFKDLQLDVARKTAMRQLQLEAWNAEHELFHSGQPGDKFYIIIQGEVKVLEGGLRSTLEEVARLRTGSAFGERGITPELPEKRVRTATVITTQRCMLATLTRESYLFVTEIAELKPLIDKFWKLAAGDAAWSENAQLPLFINFANFRRLQLRIDVVFSCELDAMASTSTAEGSHSADSSPQTVDSLAEMSNRQRRDPRVPAITKTSNQT
eukprot:COSAG02_NODE_5063_length_4677_cov_9.641110_4_plen_512_part_01